jgi:surfeit locus 1 family protein
MTDDRGGPRRRRRSALELTALVAIAAVLAASFAGLGVWQLQRRVWKLALIAAVDARIHAPAVAAPGPADWGAITKAHDAYRHVRVSGVFLNGEETHVQAVTALGGGFWVMTPLRTDRGFSVLINRGFVPPEREDPATRRSAQIPGETSVSGLLRMSEPRGGFLRRNDPAHDRWYSRDTSAIAAARGLRDAAPYFIDAQESIPGGPVGGLTVVRFPNSHLVYALTWFTLAVMAVGGAVVAVVGDRRS